MSISRRTALATGAAAITTAAITAPVAISGLSGAAKAALAGEEAQVLVVYGQLNSVRQELSLNMMRILLKAQHHNERQGWAEEPPESAYRGRAQS
jgi:hypothetical protein